MLKLPCKFLDQQCARSGRRLRYTYSERLSSTGSDEEEGPGDSVSILRSMDTSRSPMLGVAQSSCQALQTRYLRVSKTEPAAIYAANLRMCYPCNFRCKAFDMGLLSLKDIFGDKQGERAVPDSDFLDP